MKKFTAALLIFVLTASLLTACRSKAPEETDSPTTSTDATVDRATQGSTETTPSMDDIMPNMDGAGDSGSMDGGVGGNDNARGQRRNVPFD